MVCLSSKMKRCLMPVLVLAFLALGRFCAFASAATEDPALYAFSLALMLNGVDASSNITMWYDAYKCHAQHVGDSAALSAMEGLKSCSWGESGYNMEPLYNSVRNWVADAGVDASGNLFYTSIAPSVHLEKPEFEGAYTVQSAPVTIPGAEVSPYWNEEKYSYVFSTLSWVNGRTTYSKSNYFRRNDGADLFAVAVYVGDSTIRRRVYFYQNNGDGTYSEYGLFGLTGNYKVSDDSVAYKPDYSNASEHETLYMFEDAGDLCDFPFPVFMNETDALEYCQDGSLDKAVKDNAYPLETDAFHTNVSGKEISSVGSLDFPASAADGSAAMASLRASASSASYKELSSLLLGAGVSVTWKEIPYTVNYYYDGILKRTETFSIQPDDSTVSEVPVSEDGFYKLGDAPYDPPLPFAVDAQHNSISVRYVSRAADSIVKGATGAVSGIGRFLVSILPYALVIVGIVLFTILSIRLYKRLVNKA